MKFFHPNLKSFDDGYAARCAAGGSGVIKPPLFRQARNRALSGDVLLSLETVPRADSHQTPINISSDAIIWMGLRAFGGILLINKMVFLIKKTISLIKLATSLINQVISLVKEMTDLIK